MITVFRLGRRIAKSEKERKIPEENDNERQRTYLDIALKTCANKKMERMEENMIKSLLKKNINNEDCKVNYNIMITLVIATFLLIFLQTTLVASAVPAPIAKVTYNGNGSTGGSVPSSQTQDVNSTITVRSNIESLTKTNSVFNSWNTAADGSGTNYNADGTDTFTLTRNVTLYAVWKPVVKNVTIPNTALKVGTVTATITTSHDGGNAYTLRSGTIAGYQLGNLTRVGATTYTATFTIIEGETNIATGSNITVSNVVLRDTAGNDSAWTPASITTGLWLDASDSNTITLDGRNKVSVWTDKSGKGRNATQGAAGNRPLSGSHTIGGKNAITFASASRNFLSYNGSFLANSNYHIAAVATRRSGSDRNYILGGANGSSYENLHFGWRGNTLFTLRHFGGDLSTTVTGYSTPVNVIVGGGFSKSVGKTLFYNGSEIDSNTDKKALSSYSGSAIARYIDGFGTPFYGDFSLGEIIIIPNSLISPERQKLEGYLAHKWGLADNLPAGHPYKTTPPGTPYSATISLNAETAPKIVTVNPVGGTIVAKAINSTNTNITASATITAGRATGGYAQLLIDGVVRLTDSTILATDTTVTFDAGATTNAQLRTTIPSGGVVRVNLVDTAGNSVTSSVHNPTLTVDYTEPQHKWE